MPLDLAIAFKDQREILKAVIGCDIFFIGAVDDNVACRDIAGHKAAAMMRKRAVIREDVTAILSVSPIPTCR